MGNATVTSDKSHRKNAFLKQSHSTSVPAKERHIDSPSHPNQVTFDIDDGDSFDDEDEEAEQWLLERRRAVLQNAELTRKRFLSECQNFKEDVSTKVDSLFKDLPDVNDPKFETKYKTVRQKLLKLFSNTRRQSKQRTKQK